MESENGLTYEIVLIIGTLGMLLLASTVVFFIYLFQRKLIKRKLAFREIEDMLSKQELKSAYASIEGQEMERKRLSKELHDNISSLLVTLSMYSDAAIETNCVKKKNELLGKINELSIKTGKEVRMLSHRLESVNLKHFGLESAINDMIEAVKNSKDIEVQSEIQLGKELDGNIAHNIYRILQELINNTLKHAKASKMNITLQMFKEAYISLIYEDNGIGFDTQKNYSSLGLKNIKARVENLSGDVSLESKTKGFNAIIEIPLS